jgi:membrane-bound lytic murein transglycosylase D
MVRKPEQISTTRVAGPIWGYLQQAWHPSCHFLIIKSLLHRCLLSNTGYLGIQGMFRVTKGFGDSLKPRKTMQKLIVVVLLSCLTAVAAPLLANDADPFPRPAGLEGDISFWRRIFGEIHSDQALLHDNRNLSVVYETVTIPPNASSRTRHKVADKARDRYRKILRTLATGKRSGLSNEEQRVLGLWPADITNAELKQAERRIRFQQGLADRYLAGLKRSGRWKSYIKEQLVEQGVPTGLSALPHVESSFNPEAHSHVGASGLWQFTRSTGRRFMEIDHVVDERRDPYRSSEAAAELLAYNYSILKSWPLAITAYNHGVAGMRRAVRKTGSEDFTLINREYQGRTFGFASRNFYLAFIAALEVEQNAEQYFGPVRKDEPGNEIIIRVPDYIPADALAEAVGVSENTLKKYNPALLAPVWDGTKHVPRGFKLHVPATLTDLDDAEIFAAVPATQRFANQTPDMNHKVRSGESLSQIAVRYNTSVTRLMELNNLRSRHRIRAGQTLRLPYGGVAMPAGAETYTVRSGDSLSKIAARSGIREAELLQLNGLRDKNRLSVGQVLYLRPPQASSAVATVAVVKPEPAPLVVQPEPAPLAEVLMVADAQSEAAETLAVADDFADASEDMIEAQAVDALAVPVQASLADPNDYSVASDGTIEVQAAETLGHYADWLEIRTQRLRDVNGMSFNKPVVVGRRIKLDLNHISAGEFMNRRILYHRDMQEAFFTNYRVVDTTEHKLKRGESVWVLTHRNYNVPVWLLRQYNPDLDIGSVKPGMRIIFPRIERIEIEAGNRQSIADAS